MLLTKEVEIKIRQNNVEYYKSLGYEIPIKRASESYRKRYKKEFVYDYDKPTVVKVEDLQKQSHAIVEALCDYCNEEIVSMPYFSYNNHLKVVEKIACNNCRGKKQVECNLIKYGVRSTSELDWVKEKTRNSNLVKYGVDNYAKTKECHEKMEAAIEKLYGVKHALQNKDILASCKNTCVEKYGEDYAKQFIEKAFDTFREKTGYDFPSQSPEVREKITQSYIDKYGCSNPNQSPEVREKITKTLYANSSQKASRQQRYINELYQGILNFPVKYYNVDICLSNDNIVVEYDGGFHMGNVITGRETIEEYNQKEIIRNNIIKREGYKQIKIVSSKDFLPSDQTLLQMLSEAKQYFSETAHSWMIYDIDNSRMINAENKDTNGIPYDFGSLRTIKDKDINKTNQNKI